MAIVRKKVVAGIEGAPSTHFPNETTMKPDYSGQEMLNHQKWNTLLDPEDIDEGGSTHFLNLEKDTKETRRMNASAIQAAKASNGKKKVKADVDLETDEFAPGGGFEEDEPEGEHTLESDAGSAEENKQFMDNSEDPAEGYLTVGEFDDEEEEPEDDEDLEEVSAAEEELEQPFAPQSLLETEEDREPGSTHFKNLEQDTPESRRMNAAAENDEEEEDLEDDWGTADEGSDVYKAAAEGDEMPVVDIDEMDDKDSEDVVFASIGVRVHAIKANRIIASMGKKMAVQAGHGDHYMSDQFQDVVGVEMAKHGLRAGLTSMGFKLATVNVARAETVNRRVDAKVKQVTAAVRRTNQSAREATEQCMAIAAVGINRQYFKDTHNELRAALEEEMQAAGVRGATKLIRRVFASKGVSYAKAIVTLATKLQAMPEATRNQFAEALDMTSDEPEELSDESMYGDSSSPDFQAMYTAEAEDDEFADEFEDETESPTTIHAALARPLQKQKQQISASKTGYSVTAAAILSGDAPFLYGVR